MRDEIGFFKNLVSKFFLFFLPQFLKARFSVNIKVNFQ